MDGATIGGKGLNKNRDEESEQHLLRQSGRGDMDTFEAFCAQTEGPLFGYVLGLVQNRPEAEDIAQEALLRLYRAARSGAVKQTPRAYLFSIAHNLAIDHHRRGRTAVLPTAAAPEAADRRVEQSLLREQVDKALAALPESHRSAIMLREFGELSYAEIAATLGTTLDQVKVWIYRARKRLAQLLDRDGQYVGEPNHGS